VNVLKLRLKILEAIKPLVFMLYNLIKQKEILCFVDRAFWFDLVNRNNLVHNFLKFFITFLYMFRATMCPSSGENTVPMRHLVFVTVYRRLSGIQGGIPP